MTRVGLVDLGTNSIRYDIYEIGGKVTHLHRSKDMIRLGQGLFETGSLDEGAVDRLLRTVSHYRKLGDELGVDSFQAFATSALREARDSEQVRKRVAAATGIEIQVISGSREAELIALGILENEKRCEGHFVIIDIGGGSTEVCLCRDRILERAQSLQLGVQRMQQRFLKTVPPKEIETLGVRVREVCERYFSGVGSLDRGLGSSGTVKAIGRILKKNRNEGSIRLGSLRELIGEMRHMTTSQLRSIPGMSERRVDVILAGALILEGIMESLKLKKVSFTPFAMRDGLLLQVTRNID